MKEEHKRTIWIVLGVIATGCLVYLKDRPSKPNLSEFRREIEERVKASMADLERRTAALGTSADEILSHQGQEDAGMILSALGLLLDKKITAQGEGSLTEAERRLTAAMAIEMEVNNGGFDQFFLNSSGNEAATALEALRDMGATKSAALLARAMEQFPEGKPPQDQEKRREIMEQIAGKSKPVWSQCDEEFFAAKENLAELAVAYAKKKRAEILRSGTELERK